MRRYIRRPRSDLDLIYPSYAPRLIEDWSLLTFTYLTVKKEISLQFLSYIFFHLCIVLGYSYAAYKSYTQISLLHDKRDYWHFEPAMRRHPFMTNFDSATAIHSASITLPTRTLPLLAIVDALYRRFGLPTTPSNGSLHLTQPQSTSILAITTDLFSTPQLAGSTILH